MFFFFSSRRRHTRWPRDWSSDVCSSDLFGTAGYIAAGAVGRLVDPRGRSRSTENIKVPESLRFLRDSMVATALSMVLMYLVVAVIYLARAGQETAFEAFEEGAKIGRAHV